MAQELQCHNHTGITTKLENIEKWQEHHEKATHVRIEKDINDLKNRLPLWATILISGMGTVIGYLVAFLKIKGV
ncbi:MAG: hypothetical protein ABRQ26_11610 [Syntrophomonadaceae bacterium]